MYFYLSVFTSYFHYLKVDVGNTFLDNCSDQGYVEPSDISWKHLNTAIPAGIYLLKVNNRNTRTRCEICSKLTIKTPERRQWRSSGVFIVNFEHISHLVLMFLLLTLNM